jgi:hypothetical protein
MEKLKTWDAYSHPFDLANEPEQPVFYTQFDARQ